MGASFLPTPTAYFLCSPLNSNIETLQLESIESFYKDSLELDSYRYGVLRLAKRARGDGLGARFG